jgi:hypothetical protein
MKNTIAMTIGLCRPIEFHVATAALFGRSTELELSSWITEYLLNKERLDLRRKNCQFEVQKS